jgi:hypothetical protein
MFATCVYCTGALGANEAIEVFPVGRKLAFDANAGRLWVVCPRCGRWNLSPLEERWEAIEACERLYRDTPLRASTDQIGLAKVREGTQLVRIGAPSRPEFAAWRYGREFTRRRLVTWSVYGLGAAAALGSLGLKWIDPGLASSIPLLGSLPTAHNLWLQYRMWLQPVARVDYRGSSVVLRRSDVTSMRLEADEASAGQWRLNVLHKEGRSIVGGDEATRLLGRVLAYVNAEGGSASNVDSAVKVLAASGSAQQYLDGYIARARGPLTGSSWRDVKREEILALEMALHEDTERAAMEGELAALEASWREAEEIAAIADNLLVPGSVLQRLRGITSGR